LRDCGLLVDSEIRSRRTTNAQFRNYNRAKGSERGPVALPVFKIGCSPFIRGGSVRLRGASATLIADCGLRIADCGFIDRL